MNESFAHLHLHTDASLRDGLGTVSKMITKAKRMGFQQIAMTDHGTLANAVTFAIEAESQGIKPLFGLEGYVHFDETIGHITLLADGPKGWNSLINLNNAAHASDFRQPAFGIDELIKYSDGLVCLTGCIASPFQQLSFEEAYRLAMTLKNNAFGHRLFAECMFVGDSLAWERPLRLASRAGLKTVITNDVHFAEKKDADVHPILTRMKSGFSYDSSELYLKSFDEILNQATRYDLTKTAVTEMLHRTGFIARKLKPITLKQEPHLPVVGTDRAAFADMVLFSERGRKLLSHEPGHKYTDRLIYELDVIEEMNYIDYFVILEDIITKAREESVMVGPGRGSGAGSLILYLLGITDVDPIKYGLQFERFLNPERRGMPDVDVDLESERRSRVLEYANEKYGAVPIATYSRYSHKSLTRDLGKQFRVDKKLIDKAADKGINSDEFGKIIEEHPLFDQAYHSFIGQIRHKGKHAGGVIITETEVPIERMGKEVGAAWTEGVKNELSYAGIVKFDLLGLSVLSGLRRLEEELGTFPPEPADFAPEFAVFRDGNLSGIFQFAGSDGIRELTVKLQPTCFDDLIAINALYRPGALDSGATARYPEWKLKPRRTHDYIADILEPTYGAIVYQEQVMEIFARTVKGDLGEADTARRIITKSKPDDPKWVDKFTLLRARFVGNAKAYHGLSVGEATNLWEELATHSRYSFNKSHSTAYAMISWQCAWWKYNYPTQFYAAMLNIDPENEQTYIIDAINAGIKIGPPHVNKSTDEWTGAGPRIFMPLGAVKFFGINGVNALIKIREEAGGKFDSVEQFMKLVPKRLVRARAREGLWQLGGFFGVDRPERWDDVAKLLELKETPAVLKKRERQLKYLGFIVPDAKLLKRFHDLESEGWTVGVVNSRDSRTSKFGPYTVYRLSPSGVFWSRDVKDLVKGQVVAARVSSKNGRAQSIKVL